MEGRQLQYNSNLEWTRAGELYNFSVEFLTQIVISGSTGKEEGGVVCLFEGFKAVVDGNPALCGIGSNQSNLSNGSIGSIMFASCHPVIYVRTYHARDVEL